MSSESVNNQHSSATVNLAGLTPSECLRLLDENRRTWLLPVAVCTVLALGYALVMTRYWEASQGFVVRPEASSSASSEPGKFADLYQMRTFQETILELAKSPKVLFATLQAVEKAETGEVSEPSEDDVSSLRGRLSLLPPGGAEFGKTEVCYLQVKDKSRDRALKLVSELGQQVDARLRRLQKEKSASLSDELNQQVENAQAALEAETRLLVEFETKVGADLAELRMLNASNSGQSDLRQQAINLSDERRGTETAVRGAKQLLKTLQEARQDPDQLIAMPSSLLESQPTLRRLKDGLVDAQLRASRLGGTRTADHPQVQAANQSVEYIRKDLHAELEVAISGVQVELELANGRLVQLKQKYNDVQSRLARLASLRADYANRTAALENSRLVLDKAQKKLGEVSAAQIAAHSASLMTPIDEPETGAGPGGPGRASIVLCGTFGGFALGMGWLFLTVNPLPKPQNGNLAAAAQVESEVQPAGPAEAMVATVETPVVEPEAPGTKVTAPPIPRNIPSSLPPSVAAKIAEIVAAREAGISDSKI